MPDLRPLSDNEAVKALMIALREGGGRPLTRYADCYLAGVVAECLHERLALAGVVLTVPDGALI